MTLGQAIDRYTNNAEYERRNGSLQGCMEFRQLAEWLKDYKQLLEQEPKWILVSEKLPENGTYLVTKRIIEPTVQIKSFAEDLYKVDEFDFCDKKGQCGWYDYDSEAGYWEDTKVIAWMHLPEPYKAEGENKE